MNQQCGVRSRTTNLAVNIVAITFARIRTHDQKVGWAGVGLGKAVRAIGVVQVASVDRSDVCAQTIDRINRATTEGSQRHDED